MLRLAGKGENKVIAVFGYTADACHQAVLHVRKGAPEVPVCLFATCRTLPQTDALCQLVTVHRSSFVLLMLAQWSLWTRWVALSAGTWTGHRGDWLVKLAPLLIPPFRAVILNAHGDFFPGTPGGISRHAIRRSFDTLSTAGHTIRGAAITAWHCYRDFAYWVGAAALLVRLLWWSILHRCPIEAPPAGDQGGLARFRQTGDRWQAGRLEALANSSDARWILWREGQASDEALPGFEPLFDDPRTFAVSVQSCFRAWQPVILPAAPFRNLQPGEATQVLAPVSHTILVDRRKLLALGIPRSRLSNTAWIWLFWKSAAAGWRCFSVGHEQSVPEQPGPARRQLGFLVGLLSGPLLQRFGPRDLPLSRGCVAFKPRRA